MDFEPLSLQAICRSVIRTILRNNIDIEHPDIKKTMQHVPKRPRKKRALRRLVVPIFEESDIETSDNLTDEEDRRDLGRIQLAPDRNNINGGREFNTILDLVLGLGSCRENRERENNRESEERSETRSETKESETAEERTEESVESSTGNPNKHEAEPEVLNEEEQASSSIEDKKKTVNKREKFDSGLGEDLLNERGHSSDSEIANVMDVDSDSEDNSSTCDKDTKRSTYGRVHSFFHTGANIKRIAMRNYIDSDSDSDMVVEEATQSPVTRSVYVSPYTQHMRAKIQALPLPPILKQYLNLYREF